MGKIVMRYEVGNISHFTECEVKSFEFDKHHFCIVLIDNHFYAFQNTCPHQYMPLDVGLIRDKNIICTFHGWKFDLRTGTCKTNPSCRLPIYTVQIKNRKVFVIMEAASN